MTWENRTSCSQSKSYNSRQKIRFQTQHFRNVKPFLSSTRNLSAQQNSCFIETSILKRAKALRLESCKTPLQTPCIQTESHSLSLCSNIHGFLQQQFLNILKFTLLQKKERATTNRHCLFISTKKSHLLFSQARGIPNVFSIGKIDLK